MEKYSLYFLGFWAVSSFSFANGKLVVPLLDKYKFDTNLASLCKKDKNLKACLAKPDDLWVTYCNNSRVDCTRLENHSATYAQYIADERNLNPNCIVSINKSVWITDQGSGILLGYTIRESDECK
jgi:hypothetical protein